MAFFRKQKTLEDKAKYFRKHGYVVFEADSRQREAAEVARSEFYRFKQKNAQFIDRVRDDVGTVSRIINLHAYSKGIFGCYAACEQGVEFCDRFLGEAVVYTSLYFERGSNQDLHRDTPYFVTNPLYNFLGFWVALDDVGPANGPLLVVPGSHSLPEEDLAGIRAEVCPGAKVDPYSTGLWDEYQSRVFDRCRSLGFEARELHVNKGDVVIWHPQLMHGGATTVDDTATRNSIVFHVIPRNSVVGHQDAFYGDKELPVVGSNRQKYTSHMGRKYVNIAKVGFSHHFDVSLDDLN